MPDGPTESGSEVATETRLKTTKRSFELVELIKQLESAGPTELAEELALSKSTIHRHLATLTDLGYLVESDGKYSLSLRFLDLGDSARDRLGLYPAVKEEVDKLADDIGERVQFMVEENYRGVNIYRSKGDRGIETHTHIGKHVPLYATSVGKAYLASLSEPERETVFENIQLSEVTRHTITDLEELRADLDETEERGYALNDQETQIGIMAIGVPVQHAETNETIGAVSVSMPETRINELSVDDISDRLQSAARVISLKTTY